MKYIKDTNVWFMCYTNIVLWIDNEMEYSFKLVIVQKNFLVYMVKEGRKPADSDKFLSYSH